MSAHAENLSVEGLREPMGLGETHPRFSWSIASTGRDVHQSAYELQLEGDGGVVWSTGPVSSSDTVVRLPAAMRLEQDHDYRWRVRVWIEGDAAPTEWVQARFSTSLFSFDGADARWVRPAQQPTTVERYTLGEALDPRAPGRTASPDDVLRPPQHVRQRVRIERPVRRARLFATAHGLYEAEINGAVVGDEVLAPGWDSYASRTSYQCYDVTAEVVEGDNVVGVTVADGWWAGRIGLTGSSANYGDHLEVLWHLSLQHDDGSTTSVGSDGSAVSSPGARAWADLFVGESYDARKEPTGWSTAAFDDGGWAPVLVQGTPGAELVPFAGEPVRRLEVLPGRLLRTPNGDLVADVGQVIAGRPRLTVRAPAGTRVRLEHSETLDADGEFFTNIMGPNKDQTDVFVAAGTGPETFEPTFTFHGFRYVRIGGLAEGAEVALDGVVIGSDLRSTSRFATSDERIERLHRNVVWSQRGNFLSIPTDCPQRERAGWTGDLQVFIPTATQNMHVLPFVERWLANLRAEQSTTGEVPMIVPVIPALDTGDQGIGATSAGWGDAVTIVPWVLWERYGDRSVLERNYDAMVAWVEYQIDRAEHELPQRLDGVVLDDPERERQRLLWNSGFHFGDWLAPSTLEGASMPDAAMVAPARTGELMAAMFHARSLDLTAAAAGVLGELEDQARFADRARRVRRAFAEEYVQEDGRIAADLQGPYVVALAFEMVPDALRPRLESRLVDLIHANGDRLDTGFLSVPYLLDVLWRSGSRDLALTLLRQDRVPSWLYEVDHGATTIWESWAAVLPDGTVSPMSLNHYAFGCVDDWIFRRIAGLQPASPGYRTARVEPALHAGFDSLEAAHTTPHGELGIAWARRGGVIEIEVTVPHNTDAELVLPTGSEHLGSGVHHREVAA